jgi:hypothetical protein
MNFTERQNAHARLIRSFPDAGCYQQIGGFVIHATDRDGGVGPDRKWRNVPASGLGRCLSEPLTRNNPG